MSWLDMFEVSVDASPVHLCQQRTPYSSKKTKAYMRDMLIF